MRMRQTPGVPGSAFPDPVIWRQTLTALRPNTTYNFKGLFFNLLVNVGPPGSNGVRRKFSCRLVLQSIRQALFNRRQD
jgi:hypothetical protein